MRRSVLISILIAIALLTTLAYHLFKPNWVLFRKGEDCFSKKAYTVAIPYYVDLLNNGFVTEKLLNHLGTAYVATGQFEKATKIFKEIIKHSPKRTTAIKELANIYVMLGRFKQAVALYQFYLQEQPDNRSVRILLARALTWSGRFEEAIVQYRKALGEEP